MDPHIEDIQIMQRIAVHDQQAFRVLYQRYGTALYSLAFRVLQNETLAEEVTQDTFLKVWRLKAPWNPDKGSLKNWLLTIAHFTAIDRLRQEKRQPVLHPDSIEDMEKDLPISRTDTGWVDGIALRTLIEQLPPEQASLIELAFYRGMTHTEIADETTIPLGTVKTRLRSGLSRLRELWLDSVKQTSEQP